MFCEKCGTRVDDGQPFCPNCGNRLSIPDAPAAPAEPGAPAAPVNPGLNTEIPAAPVNPGLNTEIPAAPTFTPTAPRAGLKLPSCGGLFDKFNEKEGLGQIFYGCTFLLLILCFVLSMLRVISAYYTFALGSVAPFFTNVITVLFTLSITFFLLDCFDKFSFKLLNLFLVVAMALVLLIYVIIWIDSGARLSVGGWFFLIFQAGLVAVSVLNLLESKK